MNTTRKAIDVDGIIKRKIRSDDHRQLTRLLKSNQSSGQSVVLTLACGRQIVEMEQTGYGGQIWMSDKVETKPKCVVHLVPRCRLRSL